MKCSNTTDDFDQVELAELPQQRITRPISESSSQEKDVDLFKTPISDSDTSRPMQMEELETQQVQTPVVSSNEPSEVYPYTEKQAWIWMSSMLVVMFIAGESLFGID